MALWWAIARQAAKRHLKWAHVHGQDSSVRAVFVGDFISTRILLDGIYEGRELECLARDVFSRLPRESTALDVGANIGNHATYFAKHFDRVVAFEPNPGVAALLQANAFSSCIEVVSIGLSDRETTLGFNVKRSNFGASRVVEGVADTSIEVTTLDALFDQLKLDDVSFLKIDVEGHEDKVILGASRLLASVQPVIALEGWYETDPEKGERVEALLRGFGYEHFYCFTDRRPGGSRALHRAIPKLLRRRRPLSLERMGGLIGQDHDMAVCATRPLQ